MSYTNERYHITMLISYLIPVYNVKPYLPQCLDSILAQQGADFEVVLLDDGSTDGSGEICDRYAKARPDIVRVIHKENEGLLATRRRGFLEAKGDWFVCVDSDDYIKENHLQTIADTIRQYDCDMVMFDYESFYPDGHTEPSGIDIAGVQVFEGDNKNDIYEKRLLKNKYNNMWSRAVKRSVMDFETDYSVYGVRNMCEDALQVLELYTRAERIVFVPEVLYAYRRNIASISANISMDYWHAVLTCTDLGWKYIELWNMPQETAAAYGARCVSVYCDFLTWLTAGSKLDLQQQEAVFRERVLQNEKYKLAVKRYQKKYLATRYLRLRNPLVVRCVQRFRSCRMVKMLFRLERVLRQKR